MERLRTSRSVVAEYEADVTAFAVESRFRRVPTDSVSIQAITNRPEWMPFPWPSSFESDEELLDALLLAKMLTIFEFGSGLSVASPSHIREALLDRNPLLRGLGVTVPGNWKVLRIEAHVYDDGTFDGGFVYPEEGASIPLRDQSEEAFDEFVKNVVRADIREQLDRLMPGWEEGALAAQ